MRYLPLCVVLACQVAWADPRDPYAPEVFQANVEKALRKCDLEGLSLLEMDCDGSVCLPIFESTGSDANLADCRWWTERYPGDRAFGRVTLATPTGTRSYSVLVMGSENQHKRLLLIRERMAERWGVNTMSEMESLRAQIQMYRELAAAEPDDEQYAAILSSLEVERNVMREQSAPGPSDTP